MADSPVIIITGASRGMGADTARWLAKAGASLVLIARTKDKLLEVAEDVKRPGGKALVLCADVSDPDAAPSIVHQTIVRFGRLDAVINNAGVLAPLSRLADTDPAAWQQNLAINLSGPFYMIRAAIPELRKTGGRVINISSGAARHPVEAWGAYCTAKAGLTHLTTVLAAEEPAITAVAVRPGVVDTAMQEYIRADGPKHMPPEKIAYFQGLKDRGKLEPPRIPARAIAWLALHAPKNISGEFVEYSDPRIAEPALVLFGAEIG